MSVLKYKKENGEWGISVTPGAVEYIPQELTETQKTQARQNIEAGDMLKSVYDSDGDGIVDNAERVNGYTVEANVPANAKFTDTVTTIAENSGAISAQGLNVTVDGAVTYLPRVALYQPTGDYTSIRGGKLAAYDSTGHLTHTDVEYATKADVEALGNAMRFLGVSDTIVNDGSTLNTIRVNNELVTAKTGDVVLFGGYEYVWAGSAWEQLGQEGSFSIKGHTHSVTCIPEGVVSAPEITVTPNTTTVNSITSVGSLPSLTFNEGTLPSASLTDGSASLNGSVSNGPNRTLTLTHSYSKPVLTFNEGTLPSATFNKGTLPTKGSNITVVTSIKSATATEPVFTGTEKTHTVMPSST